jgi:hypothetical protein
MSPLTELLPAVPRIQWMSDAEFHAFQYDLVLRYRRHEEEQEPIAVAVTRACAEMETRRMRDRLEELLAMLDATHDPFID